MPRFKGSGGSLEARIAAAREMRTPPLPVCPLCAQRCAAPGRAGL
ncbi:MAG: hypothetical protein RL375_3370, partial [Pseudomonadota bacterium]